MDVNKLVRMANQIAANFDYGKDPEKAVVATADHLRRFWEPQMRRRIVEHYRGGETDLSDVAARAVARLAEEQPSATA